MNQLVTSGCTGQISAVTFLRYAAKKPPSKICSVSRALVALDQRHGILSEN